MPKNNGTMQENQTLEQNKVQDAAEERQFNHFYTYLPESPTPVAGPITVYWSSGSSGKKCGVIKVNIGGKINGDLSSRGVLAELATIYHYWCDQMGGVRERDGRNLTFHATNAELLASIITDSELHVAPIIHKASRVMAIRFMDAFVVGDSKEFFEDLKARKPMELWDKEDYQWYRIQKPIIHMHGVGKVTLAYNPVAKWARIKDSFYRKGAWKYIRTIARDTDNCIVFDDFHGNGGAATRYISVFAPRTGTLFHLLKGPNAEDEVILFDLQVFAAEERTPRKIVTIAREYGVFDLDISPVAFEADNT